jgi:hypothetical protein
LATVNQIREALRAQPFRPFTLRLSDGQVYPVRHPDFLMLPPVPRGREMVYWTDAEMHLIDLGLVAELFLPIDEGHLPAEGKGA